jgi:hypothetical protein
MSLVKAGRMREARQGGCAMQVKLHARGKAEQMRESRQGGCAIQGRADARGNAG